MATYINMQNSRKDKESKKLRKTYEPDADALLDQARAAWLNLDKKKEDERRAKKNYDMYLNKGIANIDNIDFLELDPKSLSAAEKEREDLLQAYKVATKDVEIAQKQYDEAFGAYTAKMTTAEADYYNNMDLGELGKQIALTEEEITQRRGVATQAEYTYGNYIKSQEIDAIDYLETGAPRVDDSTQQEYLLAAQDARNKLSEALDRYNLMTDTYTYRTDMQTISEMKDIERVALEINANNIDVSATFDTINSLTPEQRAQLRQSGKYLQILLNPNQFLLDSGYKKDQISRLTETYSRHLNSLNMQKEIMKAQEFAEEYPFASTATTYPAKIVGDAMSGVTAIGSTAWHDLGFSNYHTIDINHKGYTPTVYTDTVRDTVSSNWGDFGGTAYNNFNDAMDTILLKAIPGKVSENIIEVLGNFGTTARDAAKNGGTVDQSASLGIVAASAGVIADAIYSPTKLSKALIYGEVKEKAMYLLQQLANSLVLGEDSDIRRYNKALQDIGMSEDEIAKGVKDYLWNGLLEN